MDSREVSEAWENECRIQVDSAMSTPVIIEKLWSESLSLSWLAVLELPCFWPFPWNSQISSILNFRITRPRPLAQAERESLLRCAEKGKLFGLGGFWFVLKVRFISFYFCFSIWILWFRFFFFFFFCFFSSFSFFFFKWGVFFLFRKFLFLFFICINTGKSNI